MLTSLHSSTMQFPVHTKAHMPQFGQSPIEPATGSFLKSIPALAISGLALGTTYVMHKKTANQIASLKTDMWNTLKKTDKNSTQDKKEQKIWNFANAGGLLTLLAGTIWTAVRTHETDSIQSELLRSALDPSYELEDASKRFAKKVVSVVEDQAAKTRLMDKFKAAGTLS